MNDEEFWQLCYVIALYKGDGKTPATKQANFAASIANQSVKKLIKQWGLEDEEDI